MNRRVKTAPFTGTEGFTLMELVVAVFIIGVMTSVVMPHLLGISKNVQEQACGQNQRMIRAALDEYFLINHTYPTGTSNEQLETLVNSHLLQSTPTDPDGGQYQITEDGDSVEVSCDVHGTLGE